MAVMELLLFSGLGVGMCGVATHSVTDSALGQVQVEVDAVVCRVAGEGGAHGVVSGSVGRSLRWSAGLVQAGVQAQQQHRMTPQHMEAMCVAVTAVVEDMPPVEHEWPGLVHGAPVPSCGPDGDGRPGSVVAGRGEA
jgi:hypothetical protein